MKKINKHLIICIIAALFIVSGFTSSYLYNLAYTAKGLLDESISGNLDGFSNFTKTIDSLTTEKVRYHEFLMDINSLKNNLTNTRIVTKDGTTYVRSDENSVLAICEFIPDESMQQSVSNIVALKQCAENNGAEFLFTWAPNKTLTATIPENITDYSEDNSTRFLNMLSDSEVPVFDLAKEMKKANLLNSDAYFLTDHHWKSTTGFWANGVLCQELKKRFGFEYNKTSTDLSNYTIQTYPDWFLGSYGKKVGQWFTFEGADDFDLILPKFNTSLSMEIPSKSLFKEGTFEETIIDKVHLETKDYYSQNPYVAYCGGDFRLQIIKNNLNPDGETIVLVRDSFSAVVAPYLALSASEVHIIDVRDFIPYDNIDVHKYIDEIDPDYVIVLYQNVAAYEDSSNRYNFCY